MWVTSERIGGNPKKAVRLGSLYTILTKGINYEATSQRKRDIGF